MKAFAIAEFGQPGTQVEIEPEAAGPGQVRVRVIAASVNPVDWKVGMGYLQSFLEHRFPLVLGQDFSGIVESVGPGVTGIKVGDEVFGYQGKPYMGRGSMAELVTAPAASIVFKPQALTHVEAATLPLAGVTALMSVDALGDVAGLTVVIIGAAGGVGSYAVQIARGRGAHVIGIARSAHDAYLRDLGVDGLVDYTRGAIGHAIAAETHGEVAGVIHLAGDDAELGEAARLVRNGGVVVTPMMAAPQEAGRVNWVVLGADPSAERLSQLVYMLRDGSLRLPPIKTYGLVDAAAALAESTQGHVQGKLVIEVARVRAIEGPGSTTTTPEEGRRQPVD